MISKKLDIGKNLQELRVAKKYTQTVVAKAVGMKQPGYSDIESNLTMPTIPTLQKLAEFLEVPLAKLLEDEGEKTSIIHNINNEGTLNSTNGTINGNNTNNFFENKETEEKLKTVLSDAIASMVANEVAKITKNKG